MWFVTAALASADPVPAAAPAPEPEARSAEELRAEARKRTTRGAVEVGVGLAAAAGGVFVLSYQRGDTGVSHEDPWVMDLRSAGGAALLIGGLTTVVIGGNDVSVGRRLRLEAATLGATWVPGGAGAVVAARF
jgi:hypothetical protein